MNDPVCELDKAVNKLKLKYRTYIVEYDIEQVCTSRILFPTLFLAYCCIRVHNIIAYLL
jgi:hypothetical protein